MSPWQRQKDNKDKKHFFERTTINRQHEHNN